MVDVGDHGDIAEVGSLLHPTTVTGLIRGHAYLATVHTNASIQPFGNQVSFFGVSQAPDPHRAEVQLMTTRSNLHQIGSKNRSGLLRLWLLIAVVAMIAAACSSGFDSLTDASDTLASDGQADDGVDEVVDVVNEPSDDSGDGGDFDEEATEAATTAADQAPTTTVPAGGSGSATPTQGPTDLGREIIFTAAVTIEVDDVAATGRQATEAIDDLGGFVFGEESIGGARPETTLVFKVRPDDFSEALDALGGIGELRNQRITTDDVTERVVDLQSRISTTELGVDRLRTAMEGAANLEDFARLEEQLLSRESDLEVLRGRLRTLRDQIDLATITLTIVQDEVRNSIQVITTRYEGHDEGVGCPGGEGGTSFEPGDLVTVCFEVLNTGDQTLTGVGLSDSVLEIDTDDLTVVFGDADDLQPGQTLMFSHELTAERTVNMRVAVTGTPTNGTSTDATGPVARTTVSPRIPVDQSAVSAGFGDGFDAATSLLARLWVAIQVLAGFFLPLLVLAPFAWLGLVGLRRLRRNRIDAGDEETGFEEMPPPPNVASA